MKDSTTRIDGDYILVDHFRLPGGGDDDNKVSPTVVSCATATNEDDGVETTTHCSTSSISSSNTGSGSSNSSDAAVIVAHRSWMTKNRNTTKSNNNNNDDDDDDAIPKAITLTTTTTVITKQLSHNYCPPPNTTTTSQPETPSGGVGSLFVNHATTLDKLTTDELYQQLQKRLRPEDIPSIPTLSSRNQRRRYNNNIPSNTCTDTAVVALKASYRPVCSFINYMGTKSRTVSPILHLSSSSPSVIGTDICYSYNYRSSSEHSSRFGKFPKPLITLHDDDNDSDDDYDMGMGTFDGNHHFASIVSVNGSDEDDMFLLSNLDTLDWGMDDDVFALRHNESDMMSIEEPNRSMTTTTTSCLLPNIYGGTATKIKHLDQIKAFTDHNYDKTLFDSFTMPNCHDDVAILFDFEL